MSDRLLAKGVMAAAVVCGVGGIGLLVAFPGGWPLVRFHWPLAGALCWDAFLSLLFFLQHSGMVRRGFRARLAIVIPPRYHGAVYSIASGVALAVVVLFWQPSDMPLLILNGLSRGLAQTCAILAIVIFVWGASALRGFDPFGLGPIRAYLHGQEQGPPPFVVRGPYRWVRHPLYFAILLLIWVSPDVTADRLLFNILWTAWIYVGARLEEKDLVRGFGDSYERYRRKVPILIPWRGRVKLRRRHSVPRGSLAEQLAAV